MKSVQIFRTAFAALALACTLMPAHAQFGGGGGAPFVPTYRASVFINLSSATTNALSAPYGQLEVPMGQSYSGEPVPAGASPRPTGLQWERSSLSGPISVVDRDDNSPLFDDGPGFSMVTADGDRLQFANLSFNLATGSVNGSILINGQGVLTDLIWSGSGQPLPGYLNRAGVPLVFTAEARGVVSSFVSGISTDAVRDQYQLALLDGALGNIWAAQTVSSPIPEPGSMALMGLGLLGLGMVRARRHG